MSDILSNLELWLKLDSSSGTTATDSSGNSRDQTIAGSGSSWATGKISNCLNFGGSAYINTGVQNYGACTLYAGSSPTHVWTAACWFYETAFTNQGGLIMRRKTNSGVATFGIARVNTGAAVLTVYCRGTNTAVNFSLNAWQHIAITWDGTTCKAYLNGSYYSDMTVGTEAEETTNICVGARDNGGSYKYVYKMDDVRLYSRCLDSTDIAALYAYSAFSPAWAAGSNSLV